MKTKVKQKKPLSRTNGAAPKPGSTKRVLERKELGEYIVADQAICFGKPTFKGTRIMVWQVLERVADDEDWAHIIKEYHNSITREGIAEAIRLASEAMLQHERLPRPELV